METVASKRLKKDHDRDGSKEDNKEGSNDANKSEKEIVNYVAASEEMTKDVLMQNYQRRMLPQSTAARQAYRRRQQQQQHFEQQLQLVQQQQQQDKEEQQRRLDLLQQQLRQQQQVIDELQATQKLQQYKHDQRTTELEETQGRTYNHFCKLQAQVNRNSCKLESHNGKFNLFGEEALEQQEAQQQQQQQIEELRRQVQQQQQLLTDAKLDLYAQLDKKAAKRFVTKTC